MSPSFSVVVNTYNRADHLRRCLRSLQRMRYEQFEIVVVNGPSTDGTSAVLADFADSIKMCETPERNLSASRNVGIAAADGDVVAFIDDDALAHPDWLSSLAVGYADAGVGGVGGFTLNHTGAAFQATSTVCDRYGRDFALAGPPPPYIYSVPGCPRYTSLLGTNSSFRRDALQGVGGFDENFAYYLDETDVCLRLVDEGYKVLYAPDAYVLHQYAASHTRTSERIPRTLLISARSKGYFIARHGQGLGASEAQKVIDAYRTELLAANRWLMEAGKISPQTEERLNTEVEVGLSEGCSAALDAARLGHERWPSDSDVSRFRPVTKLPRGLGIALFCRWYPPVTQAGIALWTQTLARGMSSQGHDVHVITQSRSGVASLDQDDDGVWVHEIVPQPADWAAPVSRAIDAPPDLADWSAAATSEVMSMPFDIDVISAPIWDLEGIAVPLLVDIPLVTSLHTTYATAQDHKPDWRRPGYRHTHVKRVIAGEQAIFASTARVVANSSFAWTSTLPHYDLEIAPPLSLVPHSAPPLLQAALERDIDVLFVGRKESRKGFDVAVSCASSLTEDPAMRMVFVGDDAKDPEALQAAVRLSELAIGRSNLVVFGELPREQLEGLFARSRVVFMPSRYESFGLVATEALAAGAIPVLPRTTGVAEFLHDGVDAFVYDPVLDDPLNVLRIALSRVDGRMVDAARDSAATTFSADAMAAGYARALQEAVQSQ